MKILMLILGFVVFGQAPPEKKLPPKAPTAMVVEGGWKAKNLSPKENETYRVEWTIKTCMVMVRRDGNGLLLSATEHRDGVDYENTILTSRGSVQPVENTVQMNGPLMEPFTGPKELRDIFLRDCREDSRLLPQAVSELFFGYGGIGNSTRN